MFARDTSLARGWLGECEGRVICLDHLFDSEDIRAIPGAVADAIVHRANCDTACYLVPGAANVGDLTVQQLAKVADVEVIAGVVGAPSAVGSIRIVDALALAIAEAAYPFDAGLESLDAFVSTVITNFRGSRVVQLASQRIERQLGNKPDARHGDTLTFMPESEPGARASLAGFEQIMATLRAPGGCPWDQEQTIATLLPQLTEELDEFSEAVAGGDHGEQAEELGDVLLHIVMIAQIAREAGQFTMADVLNAVSGKMVRRHPHVFGDREIENVEDLHAMWDEIKQQEKAASG